jgi:hypothetical protein
VANLGILNEYPITSKGEGLEASLGDLFGGEQRKLVFYLAVPAMADLGPIQVAEAVIRWTDIRGPEVKLHTRTVPVSVNVVPGAEAEGAAPQPEVIDQVVILRAAKAWKEARELADRGDLDGARRVLAEQVESLRSIKTDSTNFAAALDDLEELERFDKRFREGTYDRLASKEMWDQSRRRFRTEELPQAARPDLSP